MVQRLFILALLFFGFSLIGQGSSFANPHDTALAISKFKKACEAAGGTVKAGPSAGIVICTKLRGGTEQCDYRVMPGTCTSGPLTPTQIKSANEKAYEAKCVASGGTAHEGPRRDEVTCVGGDGNKETCHFNATLSYCIGQAAPPPPPSSYDRAAAIGKQASDCVMAGGSFASVDADHYACTLPHDVQTCWYGPDFAVCTDQDIDAPKGQSPAPSGGKK